MTPRKLNQAIRNGEIFFAADRIGESRALDFLVLKAKSVKIGLDTAVKVQSPTKRWHLVTHVRRSGSQDWILLVHEGRLDWAIN